MSMQDLKITKKEAEKANKLVSPYEDAERYPYSTRITLDKDILEKLGIKTLPNVGSALMFEAKAKVIGSRQSATQGSESRSVELQITHIDLDAEDTEKDGALTRGDQGAMSRVAKKMKEM